MPHIHTDIIGMSNATVLRWHKLWPLWIEVICQRVPYLEELHELRIRDEEVEVQGLPYLPRHGHPVPLESEELVTGILGMGLDRTAGNEVQSYFRMG